ncbi:alpha/beta hydrolase fold domain-containing protein [Pseudomonas chlororaphis]|uniref:flavin-containing monooxygenase n=1 Tax=Pseudomonas chlororaphis TaxID=587753 RepID=UPI001B32F295|nr:alpha/beta hydrolase fold domain-containing protein [Pseudomonas chlororaphis]MBP5073039.1 alpha/beta hydrolase fold domain-containing protein [Pseudomonas chlororaphis]
MPQLEPDLPSTSPLTAVIIGSGFAGIGMAIALRKAGITDFIILEKQQDVGGVWRDNSYPGAACDVPSHLYSFSFEPNPGWTRMFAPQAEIQRYLQHCVRKYEVARHIRFGAEVQAARFDEASAQWCVTEAGGREHRAALLISATGQLSRPALPTFEGMQAFKGRVFHSASWDHGYSLAGKRVAVIGTGASAIQFVPAIADSVAQLKVFQRSPAYILPRPDRAYSTEEQQLFARKPWRMALHRAAIYLRYESRALGFTRFKGLMKWAVGLPFRRLLNQSVGDPQLRRQLIPDYPIGCKRILLSSDYLKTLARPNVQLITEGIGRITEQGIETLDGKQHPVDAIIYGTGFAATQFLAPMTIVGRGGGQLQHAWEQGARAYLGLAVPGFPNFFMLYGPNTNLGHNSIVYMLESQISHVMRCWRAMHKAAATTVEVDEQTEQRFHQRIQRRLADSVWSGCQSWYVDAAGHNSTNWPGFTLSYRWLTRYSALRAYGFSRALAGESGQVYGRLVAEPRDGLEVLSAGLLRQLLRLSFRALIGPPRSLAAQRRIVNGLSWSMFGCAGVSQAQAHVSGVPLQVLTPDHTEADGVMLYLHGGAFCLGGPATHRSLTSRLAREAGMAVWVPDYRLAPEHPFPSALEDALACYQAIRAQGYSARQILLAGDSAGGSLALALALTLQQRGEPFAAGLLLLSPVTDATLSGSTLITRQYADPMLRRDWLEQGLRAYAAPADSPLHSPLTADLRGLPPMLIQVGDQELLLADSTRLAERALHCGVACRLEVHAARWHVFQLQAFYLRSARQALRSAARFARRRLEDRGEPCADALAGAAMRDVAALDG